MKPGTRGTRDFVSDDRSELGFSGQPSGGGLPSSDNISRADEDFQGTAAVEDPITNLPTAAPEYDNETEEEEEQEEESWELPQPLTEEELSIHIEEKLGGFVRRQQTLSKTSTR